MRFPAPAGRFVPGNRQSIFYEQRKLSIMKQKVLTLGVMLIFLVSACAPQATPTVNPADVQHTAEAAAFTMVAETQASMPTNTPVPPTATASPTIPATTTPIASLTTDPLLPTAIGAATSDPLLAAPTVGAPTNAPQPTPVAAATSDCNKALTKWEGPSASFSIVNETKPQGKIILSLYVVTDRGECGYLADLSQGPVGMYSAGAFVEGDKDFKVFGGFRITEGSWKITVRNDKILALGSCYPGC
jgi:hypothetical protein